MNPALRLLLVHKLRGALRKQARRLKTPSGVAFALVGLGLVVLWMGALLAPAFGQPRESLDPARLRVAIQTGCLVLTALTLSGAFTHRGLYMPREEIEFLFSAPLSRRDIVRYRLTVGAARAAFGALVLSLVAVRHAPSPLFAALGVFVAAQTLPILGQGLSILLGDAENRTSALLARLPMRPFQLAVIAILMLSFAGLAMAPEAGEVLRTLGVELEGGSVLDLPWLARIGAPFQVWSRTIAAESWSEFLPWITASLMLWLGLFELVAHLPVDFRELSLATSSDVARRLRRRRKGGAAASAGEVARGSAQWRVPRVFGRGPAGAIAWRKTCSILRKARGTLLTSMLIVGGLTVLSLALDRGTGVRSGLPGTVLIALVGTLYLCAGLRFDFREDLDAMESIKSWPVAGWKAFSATLVPEVVLVSALLSLAIVVRSLATGGLGPEVVLVIAAVPVVVLLWTAIDNAVFLYMPVRFTPGQEGALHHTGRAMVLMLLRMFAFLVVVAGALAALATAWLLEEYAGLARTPARALGLALFALVLSLEILAVIAVGGMTFRRFDVARDRG